MKEIILVTHCPPGKSIIIELNVCMIDGICPREISVSLSGDPDILGAAASAGINLAYRIPSCIWKAQFC